MDDRPSFEERRAKRKAQAARRPPDDAVRQAWMSNDLSEMLKVIDVPTHPESRHFLLLSIAGIAHRERNRDPKMRELLYDVCRWFMDEAPELTESRRQDDVERFGRVVTNIPMFKYLADLLWEDGQPDAAIEVCNKGVLLWPGSGTESELKRLIDRIRKKPLK